MATRVRVPPQSGALSWENFGKRVADVINEHDDLLYGDWADYTSVWSGSTSNPTFGGSTIMARYRYSARKLVTVVTRYTITGGAKGSGNYSWNLPVPAADSIGRGATGSWIMNDSGSALRSGAAIIETTPSTLKLFQGGAASTLLTSTVLGGVWTTSWLQFTISYETE